MGFLKWFHGLAAVAGLSFVAFSGWILLTRDNLDLAAIGYALSLVFGAGLLIASGLTLWGLRESSGPSVLAKIGCFAGIAAAAFVGFQFSRQYGLIPYDPTKYSGSELLIPLFFFALALIYLLSFIALLRK
jgi:hypothetical protein